MTDTITERLKAIETLMQNQYDFCAGNINNQPDKLAWRLAMQSLATIQATISSAETDAGKLAHRLSSDEFITMECLNSGNHHKYSYAIEEATEIITAALLKAGQGKQPSLTLEEGTVTSLYDKGYMDGACDALNTAAKISQPPAQNEKETT